ncbi:MAG: transcriptional regulator [Nitrososphaeria archaeon]|nr:transcriptional regulator [Nitrososphaeria archaeon]NIN52283.1 transcriptional regulator [Nitrososphaeria archaeon]NIQ32761.1 transcriptional regulator [Nitrososphaeria archaeon]
MDEVTVVDVKPQLVTGIRKRGHYREIAELLPRLYEYATKRGATFTAPPIFVCHETAEEAMEADKTGNALIEVAAPIAENIEETKEIKCYTLPGGKMAKIIHKGPYDKCEPTYEKIFAWIEKNGKKIAGPTREAYLNDPREVGLEEAITEIYVPIK